MHQTKQCAFFMRYNINLGVRDLEPFIYNQRFKNEYQMKWEQWKKQDTS